MIKALDELEPVARTETLGIRVGNKLRSAIMAGQFRPGEKLTIRAVAAALDVSLTPAREALYKLAAEGVLELKGNGSVHLPSLSPDGIIELMRIRCALEGLAAREAAGRISDTDIAAAVRVNDELVEADRARADQALINLNWRFHFLIYNASAMPQLVRMIEGCWLQTGSYLNIIYPDYGLRSDGIRNHERIIESLMGRDPERLAQAVCRDIEGALNALHMAVSRDLAARAS